MSSQSSQLHNPRSVWFLGAPLSKAMALSTAVIYVAAEMKHWHESMVFGEPFDPLNFVRRRNISIACI
jgi:hypothetical protein